MADKKAMRTLLTPGSQQQEDVFLAVINSFLDDKYMIEDDWKLQAVEGLYNEDFYINYTRVKDFWENQDMVYGYVPVGFSSLMDCISKEGKSPITDLNHTLGDVRKGVNLCLYADICLKWAKQRQYANPWIVVYKVIKGRTLHVPARKSESCAYVDPLPEFNTHCCEDLPNASDSLEQQVNCSQIFLYEFDDDGQPVNTLPSHCLPWAILSFTRRSTVEATGNLPQHVNISPQKYGRVVNDHPSGSFFKKANISHAVDSKQDYDQHGSKQRMDTWKHSFTDDFDPRDSSHSRNYSHFQSKSRPPTSPYHKRSQSSGIKTLSERWSQSKPASVNRFLDRWNEKSSARQSEKVSKTFPRIEEHGASFYGQGNSFGDGHKPPPRETEKDHMLFSRSERRSSFVQEEQEKSLVHAQTASSNQYKEFKLNADGVKRSFERQDRQPSRDWTADGEKTFERRDRQPSRDGTIDGEKTFERRDRQPSRDWTADSEKSSYERRDRQPSRDGTVDGEKTFERRERQLSRDGTVAGEKSFERRERQPSRDGTVDGEKTFERRDRQPSRDGTIDGEKTFERRDRQPSRDGTVDGEKSFERRDRQPSRDGTVDGEKRIFEGRDRQPSRDGTVDGEKNSFEKRDWQLSRDGTIDSEKRNFEGRDKQPSKDGNVVSKNQGLQDGKYPVATKEYLLSTDDLAHDNLDKSGKTVIDGTESKLEKLQKDILENQKKLAKIKSQRLRFNRSHSTTSPKDDTAERITAVPAGFMDDNKSSRLSDPRIAHSRINDSSNTYRRENISDNKVGSHRGFAEEKPKTGEVSLRRHDPRTQGRQDMRIGGLEQVDGSSLVKTYKKTSRGLDDKIVDDPRSQERQEMRTGGSEQINGSSLVKTYRRTSSSQDDPVIDDKNVRNGHSRQGREYQRGSIREGSSYGNSYPGHWNERRKESYIRRGSVPEGFSKRSPDVGSGGMPGQQFDTSAFSQRRQTYSSSNRRHDRYNRNSRSYSQMNEGKVIIPGNECSEYYDKDNALVFEVEEMLYGPNKSPLEEVLPFLDTTGSPGIDTQYPDSSKPPSPICPEPSKPQSPTNPQIYEHLISGILSWLQQMSLAGVGHPQTEGVTSSLPGKANSPAFSPEVAPTGENVTVTCPFSKEDIQKLYEDTKPQDQDVQSESSVDSCMSEATKELTIQKLKFQLSHATSQEMATAINDAIAILSNLPKLESKCDIAFQKPRDIPQNGHGSRDPRLKKPRRQKIPPKKSSHPPKKYSKFEFHGRPLLYDRGPHAKQPPEILLEQGRTEKLDDPRIKFYSDKKTSQATKVKSKKEDKCKDDCLNTENNQQSHNVLPESGDSHNIDKSEKKQISNMHKAEYKVKALEGEYAVKALEEISKERHMPESTAPQENGKNKSDSMKHSKCLTKGTNHMPYGDDQKTAEAEKTFDVSKIKEKLAAAGNIATTATRPVFNTRKNGTSPVKSRAKAKINDHLKVVDEQDKYCSKAEAAPGISENFMSTEYQQLEKQVEHLEFVQGQPLAAMMQDSESKRDIVPSSSKVDLESGDIDLQLKMLNDKRSGIQQKQVQPVAEHLVDYTASSSSCCSVCDSSYRDTNHVSRSVDSRTDQLTGVTVGVDRQKSKESSPESQKPVADLEGQCTLKEGLQSSDIAGSLDSEQKTDIEERVEQSNVEVPRNSCESQTDDSRRYPGHIPTFSSDFIGSMGKDELKADGNFLKEKSTGQHIDFSLLNEVVSSGLSQVDEKDESLEDVAKWMKRMKVLRTLGLHVRMRGNIPLQCLVGKDISIPNGEPKDVDADLPHKVRDPQRQCIKVSGKSPQKHKINNKNNTKPGIKVSSKEPEGGRMVCETLPPDDRKRKGVNSIGTLKSAVESQIDDSMDEHIQCKPLKKRKIVSPVKSKSETGATTEIACKSTPEKKGKSFKHDISTVREDGKCDTFGQEKNSGLKVSPAKKKKTKSDKASPQKGKSLQQSQRKCGANPKSLSTTGTGSNTNQEHVSTGDKSNDRSPEKSSSKTILPTASPHKEHCDFGDGEKHTPTKKAVGKEKRISSPGKSTPKEAESKSVLVKKESFTQQGVKSSPAKKNEANKDGVNKGCKGTPQKGEKVYPSAKGLMHSKELTSDDFKGLEKSKDSNQKAKACKAVQAKSCSKSPAKSSAEGTSKTRKRKAVSPRCERKDVKKDSKCLSEESRQDETTKDKRSTNSDEMQIGKEKERDKPQISRKACEFSPHPVKRDLFGGHLELPDQEKKREYQSSSESVMSNDHIHSNHSSSGRESYRDRGKYRHRKHSSSGERFERSSHSLSRSSSPDDWYLLKKRLKIIEEAKRAKSPSRRRGSSSYKDGGFSRGTDSKQEKYMNKSRFSQRGDDPDRPGRLFGNSESAEYFQKSVSKSSAGIDDVYGSRGMDDVYGLTRSVSNSSPWMNDVYGFTSNWITRKIDFNNEGMANSSRRFHDTQPLEVTSEDQESRLAQSTDQGSRHVHKSHVEEKYGDEQRLLYKANRKRCYNPDRYETRSDYSSDSSYYSRQW
ncbi:uncharacterized protein [Ptychodera flava]|uniref:uncharacterized protein n=1 Tax=Ptychodera flava TaxID=63121 RepID=UPI003969BF0A